jgi:hypothetical protein
MILMVNYLPLNSPGNLPVQEKKAATLSPRDHISMCSVAFRLRLDTPAVLVEEMRVFVVNQDAMAADDRDVHQLARIRNASRGNTPAGEGQPSGLAGGDTHETNHPKDPDAVQRGSLSRLSTVRSLLLLGVRAVSYRLIQRRYTDAGSGCRATGLSSALWCIRGGIV